MHSISDNAENDQFEIDCDVRLEYHRKDVPSTRQVRKTNVSFSCEGDLISKVVAHCLKLMACGQEGQ